MRQWRPLFRPLRASQGVDQPRSHRGQHGARSHRVAAGGGESGHGQHGSAPVRAGQDPVSGPEGREDLSAAGAGTYRDVRCCLHGQSPLRHRGAVGGRCAGGDTGAHHGASRAFSRAGQRRLHGDGQRHRDQAAGVRTRGGGDPRLRYRRLRGRSHRHESGQAQGAGHRQPAGRQADHRLERAGPAGLHDRAGRTCL